MHGLTCTHTFSVGKECFQKRGTAVGLALEDGDQVKGMMAYSKLHLCTQPCLRLRRTAGARVRASHFDRKVDLLRVSPCKNYSFLYIFIQSLIITSCI